MTSQAHLFRRLSFRNGQQARPGVRAVGTKSGPPVGPASAPDSGGKHAGPEGFVQAARDRRGVSADPPADGPLSESACLGRADAVAFRPWPSGPVGSAGEPSRRLKDPSIRVPQGPFKGALEVRCFTLRTRISDPSDSDPGPGVRDDSDSDPSGFTPTTSESVRAARGLRG